MHYDDGFHSHDDGEGGSDSDNDDDVVLDVQEIRHYDTQHAGSVKTHWSITDADQTDAKSFIDNCNGESNEYYHSQTKDHSEVDEERDSYQSAVARHENLKSSDEVDQGSASDCEKSGSFSIGQEDVNGSEKSSSMNVVGTQGDDEKNKKLVLPAAPSKVVVKESTKLNIHTYVDKLAVVSSDESEDDESSDSDEYETESESDISSMSVSSLSGDSVVCTQDAAFDSNAKTGDEREVATTTMNEEHIDMASRLATSWTGIKPSSSHKETLNKSRNHECNGNALPVALIGSVKHDEIVFNHGNDNDISGNDKDDASVSGSNVNVITLQFTPGCTFNTDHDADEIDASANTTNCGSNDESSCVSSVFDDISEDGVYSV